MAKIDLKELLKNVFLTVIGIIIAIAMYLLGSNSYYNPAIHVMGTTQSSYTIGGWVLITLSFLFFSALIGNAAGMISQYIQKKEDNFAVAFGVGIATFVCLFAWNFFGLSYMWILNILVILMVIFAVLLIADSKGFLE